MAASLAGSTAATTEADAIPLYERTERERVLGPHHPPGTSSRNNLAAREIRNTKIGRRRPLWPPWSAESV